MSVQSALSYFTSVGWSSAHAAGLVANLLAESGLRPDAVGDGGKAYGIAQWHPDRQQHFAEVFGKDIRGSTLEEQLAFVHAELNRWEKPAGDALRACVTAAEAGACVSKLYERPADREGEAIKRSAVAERLFATMQPAAPIEDRSTQYQPREETAVNPMILNVLGPMLGQLIPQFGKLFAKPEDPMAPRDTAAMQIVLDAFARAALNDPNAKGTNTTQLASAINAVESDKTLKANVTKAVLTDPEVIGLLEVGTGGIGGARTYGVTIQNAEKPFWFNPTFWVTVGFFPMMYMITFAVLFMVSPDPSATAKEIMEMNWYRVVGFDPNTRTGLINLIVGFVFGGVIGVWFGTSYGSQRKTEIESTKKV